MNEPYNNNEFFFYSDSKKEKNRKAQQKRRDENPICKEYVAGLIGIRGAIKNKNISVKSEWTLFDRTMMFREELLKHLGLDDERILNQFLAGDYELDHIVGQSWFLQYPKYAEFMHRGYNLRVLSKDDNRSKSRESDSLKANLVKCLMRKERIIDEDWHRAEYAEKQEPVYSYNSYDGLIKFENGRFTPQD